MNIYLISQNKNNKSYNVYQSAVVVAANSDEARMIHPDEDVITKDNYWIITDPTFFDNPIDVWCDPSEVKVELVGYTDLYDKPTVILSDFLNA